MKWENLKHQAPPNLERAGCHFDECSDIQENEKLPIRELRNRGLQAKLPFGIKKFLPQAPVGQTSPTWGELEKLYSGSLPVFWNQRKPLGPSKSSISLYVMDHSSFQKILLLELSLFFAVSGLPLSTTVGDWNSTLKVLDQQSKL